MRPAWRPSVTEQRRRGGSRLEKSRFGRNREGRNARGGAQQPGSRKSHGRDAGRGGSSGDGLVDDDELWTMTADSCSPLRSTIVDANFRSTV